MHNHQSLVGWKCLSQGLDFKASLILYFFVFCLTSQTSLFHSIGARWMLTYLLSSVRILIFCFSSIPNPKTHLSTRSGNHSQLASHPYSKQLWSIFLGISTSQNIDIFQLRDWRFGPLLEGCQPFLFSPSSLSRMVLMSSSSHPSCQSTLCLGHSYLPICGRSCVLIAVFRMFSQLFNLDTVQLTILFKEFIFGRCYV